MARRSAPNVVAVLGLGRFGRSLALELMSQGGEVLGVDASDSVIQKVASRLTHTVVADTTDEETLRQISVQECDRAVVGMGSDLEASLLTASALVNLDVPSIWAKATSNSHAKILTQIGVHHVVRPEHDMGKRVAHLVRGRMIDYIEFDDGFAMVKTAAPAFALGKPLGGSGIRDVHGVTVVAIKRRGGSFTYATAESVLQPGDTVIVSGRVRDAEKFADLQ